MGENQKAVTATSTISICLFCFSCKILKSVVTAFCILGDDMYVYIINEYNINELFLIEKHLIFSSNDL